jgi:hypothetical protein
VGNTFDFSNITQTKQFAAAKIIGLKSGVISNPYDFIALSLFGETRDKLSYCAFNRNLIE